MMKTMRMPKGWKLVGTNRSDFGNQDTREKVFQREQRFRVAIKNVVSEKEDRLKEICDEDFNKKEEYESQLLGAFHDKRLKSKALIKKAQFLDKKKERAVV